MDALAAIVAQRVGSGSVHVRVDVPATLAARKRWPSFEGLLIGSFDGQMTLYRVFDGEEMEKIVATGKITGGKYAVPAERSMGASWAYDISAAIRFGNNARGGRLGKDIYLAKMDAMDKKFLHLGPEGVSLDPSVDEQVISIPKSVCNLGLGCSVANVSVHDVDSFYRVLPNEQIEPVHLRDLKTATMRVLDRFAKSLNLAEWGLEGFAKGQPVTLYHGTTALFRKFDLSVVREELVNKFYGAGIFLTPSKRVAVDYAGANRNIGFPPSLIEDLKRKNPKAGSFMQALYSRGKEAWDDFTPEKLGVKPEQTWDATVEAVGGVDPNVIQDVADYIIGSKVKPLGGDGPVSLFNQSTGLADWVYDDLDKLGLDSKTYRPKVYTVTVTAHNPLITASKSEAKAARHKGYDAVIYYGSDLVGGVPEVAVFNPSQVKIKHIEVVG